MRPVSQDHPSDQELVAKVLNKRDEEAFRILYRRHTPRLTRLAMNLASDCRTDLEDLVQDTWVRAAAGLARFQWRSTLLSWLSGILVNRVREAYRSEGKYEVMELTEDLVASWPPPPEAMDRRELERAIAALPPRARAVLVLHDVEGYTHEEIAGLLQIEPGTSKSQLCRARRAVVRTLNPEPKDPTHVTD